MVSAKYIIIVRLKKVSEVGCRRRDFQFAGERLGLCGPCPLSASDPANSVCEVFQKKRTCDSRPTFALPIWMFYFILMTTGRLGFDKYTNRPRQAPRLYLLSPTPASLGLYNDLELDILFNDFPFLPIRTTVTLVRPRL